MYDQWLHENKGAWRTVSGARSSHCVFEILDGEGPSMMAKDDPSLE
jgi:hypothetical protein